MMREHTTAVPSSTKKCIDSKMSKLKYQKDRFLKDKYNN